MFSGSVVPLPNQELLNPLRSLPSTPGQNKQGENGLSGLRMSPRMLLLIFEPGPFLYVAYTMLLSSGPWQSFIRQSPEHSVYCHASWNVNLADVKIPILQWGSRFFEVNSIQKNLRKGIQAITLSQAVCFDLGSHL